MVSLLLSFKTQLISAILGNNKSLDSFFPNKIRAAFVILPSFNNPVFPKKVFSNVIPRSVRISEAPSHGKPIMYYDRCNKGSDAYMALADFEDYVRAQRDVSQKYLDKYAFCRMSLTNIAKAGIFSADRAVLEYADKIWKL